jgi:hypothetical protein
MTHVDVTVPGHMPLRDDSVCYSTPS